jgi:hypothetical protein
VTKIPKCPICEEVPIYYNEYFVGEHIYNSDTQGRLVETTIDTGETETPLYFTAVCSCCHKEWRLRGVKNISQLPRVHEEVENNGN